ncbi:MAG: triose-phosphate isomerase [Elusimicrobia bacterium]|nr:triose-phosphate isomerase [Elusimicrobiota bacterium]
MSANLRRPLIAGNWKMNLDLRQSVELARALKDGLGQAGAEVAVCVPFTSIAVVGEVLKGSPIRLGAQDLHWEKEGAYTGEVSAGQLLDAGCRYVIIGHSERRRYFHESDEVVRKKLKAALAAGLWPIVCVGETLEERERQQTFNVLKRQVEALAGLAPAELSSLVIAYEPVWAIGTGKTATPEQAQEAHLFIRNAVAGHYGKDFAQALRLLYGGSVKAENIDSLMAQPDLDGALVGGESLKPVSFLRIIHFQAPARSGAR